jgi:hypothetical protein
MNEGKSVVARHLGAQVFLIFLAMALYSILFAQTERWVYRFVTPNDYSEAQAVMYGGDGNVYAAGWFWDNGRHIKVVSLTSEGTLRWVYDCADTSQTGSQYSIAADHAGNIYVSGYVAGTGNDFAVISIDTAGNPRWIYQYNGIGNGDDVAKAVACGPDGNIYAAGYTKASSLGTDFTVVSLDTAGNVRWVHNYDAGYDDVANSIAFGSDSTIYVGGRHAYDLAITSFDPDSTVNWIYRNYSTAGWDIIIHAVVGSDGNIYATGTFYDTVGIQDMNKFATLSVTPAGSERWLCLANWDAQGVNIGYSVAYGPDDNVYASGFLYEYGTLENLAVVSYTNNGSYRFTYRHPSGGDSGNDCGYSILYGPYGDVYVAGRHEYNLIVVSLTPAGVYNWQYQYDVYDDVAFSMVCGTDSNLYVSGSTGLPPSYTVLSLDVSTGVSEMSDPVASSCSIHVPFCFYDVLMLHADKDVDFPIEINIYNTLGALVYREEIAIASERVEICSPAVADLSTGVYFVLCKNGGSISLHKTIKINR